MSEDVVKRILGYLHGVGNFFEFIWNNPDEMALSIISFEMPDGLSRFLFYLSLSDQ